MKKPSIHQENQINLGIYNKLLEINNYLMSNYNIDISDKIPKLPIFIHKDNFIIPNFITKYNITVDDDIVTYYIDDDNKVYNIENDTYIYVGDFDENKSIIKLT